MARRRHPRPLLFIIRSADEVLEEYDYAVVCFSEETLRWYLDRMQTAETLCEKDREFSCICYFDYTPSYVARPQEFGLSDEVVDQLEYGVWTPVSAAFQWQVEHSASAARTECDRVHIHPERLYWTCVHKHTSQGLETDTLYREQLLGFLREAAPFDG